MKSWGLNIGDTLNNEVLTLIKKVFLSNTEEAREQSMGNKIYSLRFAPIIQGGYVNIYGTDVTALNNIESDLLQAKNQAELANIEKSCFFANMSHEMRTPMHAILGFSRLSMKKIDDEKTTTYLKNIETSAIRLTGLLNNLLDLSRLEPGKMEVAFENYDLVEICNDCQQELLILSHEKNKRYCCLKSDG